MSVWVWDNLTLVVEPRNALFAKKVSSSRDKVNFANLDPFFYNSHFYYSFCDTLACNDKKLSRQFLLAYCFIYSS